MDRNPNQSWKDVIVFSLVGAIYEETSAHQRDKAQYDVDDVARQCGAV